MDEHSGFVFFAEIFPKIAKREFSAVLSDVTLDFIFELGCFDVETSHKVNCNNKMSIFLTQLYKI